MSINPMKQFILLLISCFILQQTVVHILDYNPRGIFSLYDLEKSSFCISARNMVKPEALLMEIKYFRSTSGSLFLARPLNGHIFGDFFVVAPSRKTKKNTFCAASLGNPYFIHKINAIKSIFLLV